MAGKSYWQKLKDPRWQKKSAEIKEKAHWTCISCGDTETTLHVHHVLYRKNADPWDYPDKELQCLCEDCHKSAEEARVELLMELSNTFPPNEASFRITKILKMFNEQIDGFDYLWAWIYSAYYPDVLGKVYARSELEFPLIRDLVRTGEKTQQEYEDYVKSAMKRRGDV